MCSISGFLAPRASDDEKLAIAEGLLWAGQIRGNQATGVGFHANGAPVVSKAAQPAIEFIYTEQFKQLHGKLPSAVILHTRATTKGTEQNNVNNHPVVSKTSSIMLVHNGSVEDDDWRIRDDQGDNPFIYEGFDGEVDTEAILRLIETLRVIPRTDDLDIDEDVVAQTPKDQWEPRVSWMKAIDDAAYNIKGSHACAMLVPEQPNGVYLWRHSSPLYVAYVPTFKAILWASTEEILRKAITEDRSRLHFKFFPEKREHCPVYHGVNLDDDRLLHIVAQDNGRFHIDQIKLDPPTYQRKRVKATSNGGSLNLIGSGK